MNNQTILYFRKPGMLTTVQDLGRNGYQKNGVPIGGALDSSSAKLANQLVDNTENTPVIEITMIGPEIEFSNQCQIAITGADISAELDGALISMNKTINVKSKSILKFGNLTSGCRAYIAVGGKWKVKKWLGSASAALYQKEILTPNSFFLKGSKLLIDNPSFIKGKSVSKKLLPSYESEITVKLLKGPEFDLFSEVSKKFFLNQKFKITVDSNRMGYRLEPPIAEYDIDEELISSGIIPGTVQITNSGQPIILLVDAQTVGGYSRIGNIITKDIDRVGQLKPGDSIKFELID